MAPAPRLMRHTQQLLGASLLVLSAAGLALAPRSSWAGAPQTSIAENKAAQLAPSNGRQKALADHLRLQGVLFYGAFWCSHCNHQKELFGSEAAARLPYVECDQDTAGRQRCQSAKVRAYPSWDYKGERREGVLSLKELELWTAFPGSNR
mgnify:CR=1 FL=1